LEATLEQLRALVSTPTGNQAAAAAAPLTVIQASVGNTIRMVPINEVMYFEAADKYVRVLTASHEYLIRTPIKDLLPQLDTATFWQIHRGTVVRSDSIDSITRDESGRLFVVLRGRAERLVVSRLYAHLFKAM
jgi:DNA-binding LytR/AlgR family response regulator